MIFADTSAWFARVVPTDPHHLAAFERTAGNAERLITTDYVVDETLTLLQSRGHMAYALSLGELLFSESIADLHFLTDDEILEAWRVFRDYHDKTWSFTDATSKVVIERLGLRHAFAFDEHFRQFGSVEIVPAG